MCPDRISGNERPLRLAQHKPICCRIETAGDCAEAAPVCLGEDFEEVALLGFLAYPIHIFITLQ
jgi:hypothetical protein